MNYLEFNQQWHQFGCFNVHQLYAWRRDFNRQNLRIIPIDPMADR